MRKITVALLSSVTAIMLCLAGCKTEVPENLNDNTCYITVSMGNSLNTNSSERTASVIKPEAISYKVTAYKTNSSGVKLSEENGGETVISTEPFDEEMKLTYTLELSTGEWIFDVTGYEEGKTDVILFGNTTKPVRCNGGRYYETIYVYFTTKEKGSVKLDVDVSKVTINKLKISGTGTALDSEYSRDENTNIITIEKDNLKSGTYNAKMDFYTGTALLYSTTETINITDNLTVENWIYSGGNDYLVKKEDTEELPNTVSIADFILTPELIIQHKNTSCWIQGSNAQNSTGITIVKSPSDENTGSQASPYKTLQTAFDRTMALNKEFISAGKPQQSFTININGEINASALAANLAKIDAADNENFTLSIVKNGISANNGVIGNIEIGKNITTSIENLTMDSLKSESKLTLNNCTLTGIGPFEINGVSDKSVITNTKIGSETSGNRIAEKISFKDSNVSISNSKELSIFATDFSIENSQINIKCNGTSSDRITVKTNNFEIKDSSGSSGNELSISGVAINSSKTNTESSNPDFLIKNCNYLKLSNLSITSTYFNTSNIQNTTIENGSLSSAMETTLEDSQITFNKTSLNGALVINGNTAGKSKITFTDTKTKVSGLSMRVTNSEVELLNSSSFTTTNYNFDSSNLKIKSATLNTQNGTIVMNNCNTVFDNATVRARSFTTGTLSTSETPKTETFSVSNGTNLTLTDMTLYNCTATLSDSTITAKILLDQNDLTIKNTRLTGDIGKASSSSTASGIDTLSKVIIAGTTTINSGNVYLKDEAILYVKDLPSKSASANTIATITALYPTKGEVVLVQLDDNDTPTSFDNSFIVDEAASADGIDERFKLASPGYYLDYDVPAGDTIRKGLIKESSIGILLPETGGFTIDIATNNKVTLNSQGYIVIKMNDLAEAPVKAIIKDRMGSEITVPITYQLYRESTKIGSAVTNETITISGAKIEQEMQYTNKLTYLLQITFTDTDTNLTYSDIFVVNIIK